ncbi:hypothetical protein SAMN05421755_100466 [Nitrosomonas sp. Nm33]|nr:hypothetical protein SAMN05421755_100466 [Nitrosomonas sp. Nm33]
MSSVAQSQDFYIGWDVGGWNCDKNSRSHDAIVILDASLAIVGQPWRGNLRNSINAAETSNAWIQALFEPCAAADTIHVMSHIYLAIDTPLGFSEELINLITELKGVAALGDSFSNPYLYRKTERLLFEQGLAPLSPIKDMIGSQTTKGMHVLARFARQISSCGVWTDGCSLTVLETYPSGCQRSVMIARLRSRYDALGHEDKEDALTCALVAYLYAEQRELLASPASDIPASEGWVWVPRDALGQSG